MSLSFLPEDIKNALSHLNFNFVTEIRIRRGRAVMVEYQGRYRVLEKFGQTGGAVIAGEISPIITAATGGCVYNYTEQMKNGFITVGHGVRIGIAGEYVTEGGAVKTIKCATSLNIRVPHDIKGCAAEICEKLLKYSPQSVLIFSKPGAGKTTMLRDIARYLSADKNVLVLDERNEISATDGFGEGFDLGNADIIRCFNKLGAVESAVRAMKPDVLITDELYGADDLKAVQYAGDCGIAVLTSSHITDRNILKTMPFEYYAELTSIGAKPRIYDKNFNTYSDSGADDVDRRVSVGE